LRAEISYLNNSGKNRNKKNILAEKLKKLMNDEQFAKLKKACSNRDDHKIKILMEKLHLHHEAENIWAFFQTFRIEKKKFLNWEDKNNMVKTYRRLYENTSKGLVKKEYIKGLRIAHQYQIKEIYWKQNSHRSTTNIRRRIFDEIIKLKVEIFYLNNSGKNRNMKIGFAGRFKKIMNNEQFVKLNKACNNRDDYKIKILKKNHIYIMKQRIFGHIFIHSKLKRKKF
jgi:hypothetical protein